MSLYNTAVHNFSSSSCWYCICGSMIKWYACYLVMWRSWSKFAFVECKFWLSDLSNSIANRGICFISRKILQWFRSVKWL